jgi:N-acetylneuraminic acid mutarotase
LLAQSSFVRHNSQYGLRTHASALSTTRTPTRLAVLSVSVHSRDPNCFPDLPSALSSFGAAVVGDDLYVYGGHSGEAHHYSTDTTLGAFRRLNLKHPTRWEERPGGPKLQGLALIAWNGKVFRVGGMQPRNSRAEKTDARSLATCAVFDPFSNMWSDIEPLPEPRSSHDAAVVGNNLYVFGGWKLNGLDGKPTWHSNGCRLDLSVPDARWEVVEQPFRRRALTMAGLGGRVYVIGGMNEAGRVERTVSVFDTESQKWSEGPALPVEDSHGFTPASAVLGERLYVAPADGKPYGLNDRGDAWVLVGQFREKRFSARLTAGPEGRLLLLGGASPTSLLASVESVTPRTP